MESNLKIVMDYPGLKETHRDHSSPTPGPAQGSPKNPTTCLRVLFKCSLSSGSAGAELSERGCSGGDDVGDGEWGGTALN